jgi:uncharacterized protein involved in type VI secretion and phage assembly
MRNINGVVVGVVIDVNDPESLGRVKLRFPWMSESEPQSNWARVAAPMSGGERGFLFPPEVDDEVLVAFDQGNLNFPYVIGFLWNARQPPPHTEPKKRTIKSVSGHTVELDDSDGSEKISVLFKGGQPSITIEQAAVTIRFSDACFIKLENAGVTVKGAKIQLNPSS